MQIGRKDVLWNYAATFLKIGGGVILLPFILRFFPQETVAIWTIYSTIIALTGLLDFGFNPSFARNVSYVVSGVRELKTNGFQTVEAGNNNIDYGLFKGLINAMRWFYARMALLLFLLLATAGTYYIHTVLKTYTGNHTEVYISWIILCVINTYSLYTYYYDALMQGKGLIKRAKQIQVAGDLLYLVVAVALILLHFNLIAIVSAQALSIITRRTLSHRTVYTPDFKKALNHAAARAKKSYIKPILPNAVKLGLNGVGWFLVTRSSILVGSLFLPLGEIASYGITIQIIGIIAGIASVYFFTYQPQIAQYRVQGDISAVRHLYLHSCFLMLLTFAGCGAGLFLLGEEILGLIGSQTSLLPKAMIAVAVAISYLDGNRSIACNILLSKNEVPFFMPTLITGGLTLLLLFVFLRFTMLGVWGMLLAQGIAQAVYQYWKWPLEVWKDLKVVAS
jgi:O-antigen/teichoic acid export membrane protein